MAEGGIGRIFLGVVVATCGAFAAVTLSPVVAHELTGSAALAGLPVATLLGGAGAGAPWVAGIIRRRGPRAAMTAAYGLGAVSCLVAVVAILASSFVLLLLALAGVGAGHAANQLARYVAAELYPEERRPSVIGWMVWAQAAGAVLGPLGIGLAGTAATTVGLPNNSGGFLIGVGLFALAAGVHVLGPSRQPVSVGPAAAPDGPPVNAWQLPNTQVAAATIVTALVVMLLVMTVTPVHVHAAGHSFTTVGGIMAAHTFGMFALAPVAGHLAARLGARRIIGAGIALLAVATVLAAAAPPASRLLLGIALYALGFGWCLAFVAGSSLLTQGLDTPTRVRVQGRVEAVTWITGAVAAATSGLLLGLVGYAQLSLLAGAFLLVPLAALMVHRAHAQPPVRA